MKTVVANALKDPTYCPYCMRCTGLVRMRKVEHLYWRCYCGAEGDNRPLPTSMTKPLYFADRYAKVPVEHFLEKVTWVNVTDARRECFMALESTAYTYGSGRGVRTYTSVPFEPMVFDIMEDLNSTTKCNTGAYCTYNVCFLNRYDDQGQHLGWHADDSPGMSHEHPIAVVSFGEPREIWTRKNGDKGVVPPEDRQKLGHGSLFVMPEGFQLTNQHRIPKGDHSMKPRVSLTFRRYVP